jgi:hypothetical protein
MSQTSDGHGQILFRASSAHGRGHGARPEELDRPDRHRMTLPQIRRPFRILAPQ